MDHTDERYRDRFQSRTIWGHICPYGYCDGVCHMDISGIKENLIPPELTRQQISYKYASEADMLNVVLFGKTAKEWREEHPDMKGNIRDEATINQLLVLANVESYNAVLITQGKSQEERMRLLRELVVQQLRTLESLGMSELPQLQ